MVPDCVEGCVPFFSPAASIPDRREEPCPTATHSTYGGQCLHTCGKVIVWCMLQLQLTPNISGLVAFSKSVPICLYQSSIICQVAVVLLLCLVYGNSALKLALAQVLLLVSTGIHYCSFQILLAQLRMTIDL